MEQPTSIFAILAYSLLIIVAIWLAVRSIRWAKTRTKVGKMLVTVAFPDPEQPPPQEEVEWETRRKKEVELGDSSGEE